MRSRLQIGDDAPDFTAVTSAGAMLRLSDFRGRRAVVLFFYPKDGTAICTKEACSFRDSYEKFVEAGAEVIGVSGDSDARHERFADEHRLPFHLVSDGDGRIRRLYGVTKTLGILPGRATYVIDAQGTIRLVFSAALASDEHVRKALEALAG